MYDKVGEIIYLEENEFRQKSEVFWKAALLLRFREFENNRKTIWFIAVLLKGLIVLSISIFAYKVRKDPNKFAVCVATFPAIFMAVLKLLYMYFESERVRYLYSTIKTEFWDLGIAGPIVQKRIMKRFFIINLMLVSQLFIGVACIYCLNMYPLLEAPPGTKRLPNVIWVPFDTNPSPLYEFLYIFLLWNQVFTFLGNGFYDFTYISAIQHLCGQLALLRELLRNLTVGIMPSASDLEKFNSIYFQDAVMRRLKICIKHHNILLKYGKNIDKYVSNVLVPQLIMSYLSLVVNGYILSVNRPNLFHCIELSSYTCIIFTELVVLAIQGSDLKDQSVSVIDAIARSEWYLFRARIKRALVTLMLNAEKGIVITVGGMIHLDNTLIITMLQKVFTAITLLKALIMETEHSTN